jgi:hypothetical protein
MKPSFEVSPDVRKLCEYLEQRDHASYNDMNRLLGRFVNGRDRYVLVSAMRRLQREQGIVFVVERGVGVRRATNVQIATLGTDTVITKSHRIVNRGKKLHPLVNPQALTAEEREAFWIGKSVTQAMSITMSRKMRRDIKEELDKQGEEIDVTSVVALFSKPRKK